MRTALPNANFIAFTGTPLLGSKRLTNQWFSDYVSEYNFAQSVEDGSTVPLFYSRRVPEVGLQNDFLDDDVVDIIEDENLNEAKTRLLENSSSRILEVIKREDRLDKIARDIAHHFPRRGFLGKGMVVSVDKFTAVKMYDKVQYYWAEEKKALVAEHNTAKTKEDRDRITGIINFMDSVEMAVIISGDDDEEAKFAAQGLSISAHRAKMNEIKDGSLERLLMIESTGNTDRLVKEADSLLKEYQRTEYDTMIRLIVRKHLLTNKELTYSKKQQVIDKIFGKGYRKYFLITKE